MTKQTIARALESKYGSFVNVSQVADFLGVTRETARNNFLRGLDYLPNGRERLYHSSDIAESIVGRAISK